VATGLSVPGNLSLNKSFTPSLATSDFFGFRKGIETVATTCVLPIGNETTHGNLPRKLLSVENTVDKP
jgi:hypothetical protein